MVTSHNTERMSQANTSFIFPTRTGRSPPITGRLNNIILLYSVPRHPEVTEDGTYWCVLLLPHYRVTHRLGLGPLPAQMCLLILSSQSHNRHIGRADRILNIHVTSGRGQRGVWPHTGAGSRGGGRQEGRPVSRIRCPTILVVNPDGLALPMTSPPHLLLYLIPICHI